MTRMSPFPPWYMVQISLLLVVHLAFAAFVRVKTFMMTIHGEQISPKDPNEAAMAVSSDEAVLARLGRKDLLRVGSIASNVLALH